MKAFLLAAALSLGCGAVGAHSASDAYLTLTVARTGTSGISIHGQWDVALRDLDFVLNLDDDGNGQITWGELKHHQAAIERYVYAHLEFSGQPGHPCSMKPVRQLLDGHADGAYAALFFDVNCPRAIKSLNMKYTLFFTVDPSHRGIFVMHSGDNISTAVLSPKNTDIALSLD